jgi:hypothetical protein
VGWSVLGKGWLQSDEGKAWQIEKKKRSDEALE